MHCSSSLLAVSAFVGSAYAQVYDTQSSLTNLAGTANDSQPNIIGNYYNYWRTSNNNTVWDLTRSDRMPVTTPKTIPMIGSRQNAIIEPNRTAMVIIDMQNFFLDPTLNPHATAGRMAVQPMLDMIYAFRAHGMKILWTFWGLDYYDLVTISPSDLDGFSSNHQMNTSFCTDMGPLTYPNGTTIEMGKLLCRDGGWNVQPYGPLYPAMMEGLAAGTDLYFNKNRLSGLWGAQTPLGLYLQESQTTTLFFGGVNSDQCVFGNMIDAYFKAYDVVYMQDCSGTTSPWYAEQMVRYNIDSDGFMSNSSYVIAGLNNETSYGSK